jgi:hypothetical protein
VIFLVTEWFSLRSGGYYFDFNHLYFHARVVILTNCRESCFITLSVDIAPSLYENYVVVILYALVRDRSFGKRKICYCHYIINAKAPLLLILLDNLIEARHAFRKAEKSMLALRLIRRSYQCVIATPPGTSSGNASRIWLVQYSYHLT